ncbi:MAG: transcription antitermination factor NusB [Defluviitaleaceae bacterium]|nr:transcription antitermination factor NusB [Defluviitaleaceae bacterium]
MKLPARRTDRKHTMCLIFARDFQQDAPLEMDYYLQEFSWEVADLGFSEPDYIKRIYNGVFNNLEKIDRIIQKTATDWDISRIDKVDLAVMRLAIFEILHEKDTPAAVAINEAVDIAKEFSGEEAGKFVNGILEKVRQRATSQATKKKAPHEN